MNSSTRGAARVSLVWVITIGVVALASLAFGFIASSDLGAARDDLAAAQAEKAAADARFDELSQEVRSISEAVGWYDRESANPRTNVDAVGQSLSNLKAAFSDLGENVQDVETALPIVVSAYNTRGQKIADLENQVKLKQAEIDAARESERTIARNKDSEIASLRSEKSDAESTAQSRIDELERRVSQLQRQNSDLDLELRRAQQELADARRSFDQERRGFETRVDNMAQALSFTLPDNASKPDGEILATSDELHLGWIDRGTLDRVSPGMRFRVESGGMGDRRLKAMAEVVSVDTEKAEVLFTEVVDPFDPVVPGDVIVNPLYDPNGGRNAVLVGRFDGLYNEEEVRLLLKDIGIQVQPEVTSTTHYLIVGSEMWTDEDGEPLDEPLDPSDDPMYKQAESLGVLILPIQNVREFFTVKRRN